MKKFSVVEWLFLCTFILLSPSHSPSDKGQDTQGDPQREDEQVEDRDVGDVQVSFIATLPTDTRTRSFGKAEQVNTLEVGIFKKGIAMCIPTAVAVGTTMK